MPNTSRVDIQEAPASADQAHAKIAYSLPEAVFTSGLSRSTLYVAISRGELYARKWGARTVILDFRSTTVFARSPSRRQASEKSQSCHMIRNPRRARSGRHRSI